MLVDAAPTVEMSMWGLSRPWWEFMLRGALVYGVVLVLLRLRGKRQIGQLATFDLVLLMLISNAVQNAMNAGDNSVLGGILLVLTLMGIHGVIGWLNRRSKVLEAVVEGQPRLLVHHGRVDEAAMSAEGVTRHELMAALRQAGLVRVEDVHVAVLEASGRIDVVARRSERNGNGVS